jgi:transcription elongation GreA/GreB family factor
MNKQEVHIASLHFIQHKIDALNSIYQETLSAAASDDAKSSAGDKHETAVSMAQLEQEKITKQINTLLEQKRDLEQINTSSPHKVIQKGSLIETNNGWYYLSIGLGQVKNSNFQFFCLSPQAPLGKLLLGKTTKETISFNGKTTEIKNIF